MTLAIGTDGTRDLARAAAAAGSGASPVPANGAGEEMREMFTKLLVAQIRNQDPLNPSDPAQFVSQLTQLSQAEAMQQVSQRVLAQTQVLSGMQAFALGSHVGRDVSVQTLSVERVAGQTIQGTVDLPVLTNRAEVVLRDAQGRTFRQSLPETSGRTGFRFDDAWFVKNQLGPGRFDIHVQDGEAKLPVLVSGRIERVHLDGNGAQIDVTGVGQRIDAGSIRELSGTASSDTAANGSNV